LTAGVVVSAIFAEKERQHANSESEARRDEKIQREEAQKQTKIAQQNLHQSVRTAVDAAQNNRGATVAPMVSILKTLPRDMVLDELKSGYSVADVHHKLGLAYALAEYGEPVSPFLCSQIQHSSPDEVNNFASALRHAREASLNAIQAFAKEAESKQNWRHKARLAIVALHLEDDRMAADMCRIKDRPDPVQRTIFIDEFTAWHGDVVELAAYCRNLTDPALRSAICLAIGSLSSDQLAASDTEAWIPLFTEWFQSAPDNVTHSAAGWALRKWGIEGPALSATSQPGANRQWFVNSLGMTLLEIEPGVFVRKDMSPNAKDQMVRLTRAFFLGDREVSAGQFQQFINDTTYPNEEKPAKLPSQQLMALSSPTPNHPATWVDWYDAVMFCNWLSRKEGRTPCYKRTGKKDPLGAGNKVEVDAWGLVTDAIGYRLPTEAEWEYACRAGTTTVFASGADEEMLPKYAVFQASDTAPGGGKLPNGWGLFDMYGNVSEWCHDWIGRYGEGDVIDPVRESVDGVQGVMIRTRVTGGGCFNDASAARWRLRNLSGIPPNMRAPNVGFRPALSSVQ
jgi:formylglycine-generating enzyme required for sulfatase activity